MSHAGPDGHIFCVNSPASSWVCELSSKYSEIRPHFRLIISVPVVPLTPQPLSPWKHPDVHALASPQPTSPRHISPPISKVSHNPESWAHLSVHRRKLPCMCNVEENVVCICRFTEGGRKVVMIYSLDSGLIPPTSTAVP